MVTSFTAFFRRHLSIAIVFLVFSSTVVVAQETGTIVGVVVDKSNGEGIAGATVLVQGTKKGAYTDIQGNFRIKKVPSGVYTVTVRALGYNNLTVNNVEVAPGAVKELSLTAETEAVQKEEVIVEAAAIKDGDAALMRDRQKSIAVSDAISAESMSRVAGADVAEVSRRITGVSVMDGKYLYVRGLGDRYMNYQMNGAQMASSDPDRNDVSMDQFSSGFVESIVTSKSFTPDQPGSFTGGSVNVKTKAFPNKQSVKASVRVGYNTIATLDE